jgi:PDZ domain-containing protein
VSTIEPIPQGERTGTKRLDLTRRQSSVRILAVIIVALLLAGGLGVTVVGAKDYYALAPGSAPRLTQSSLCRPTRPGADLALPNGTPCVLISVPPAHGHVTKGSLYMVSALVGPATPLQYLLSKVGLLDTFDHGTKLVPAKVVLGTTPPGQLSCQAAQQMTGATFSATVVALRRLGYQITENTLGAQLYAVPPGSPGAAAGLRCNDIITAVNDQPIRTSTDLGNAIRASAPGQTVRLRVQRVGSDGQMETDTLSARLEVPPGSLGSARAHQGFLGVVSITRTTYTFPFEVNIDVGEIGGPSAGLALTLAILDILSTGDLTGGHAVAATGTIGLDGTVGDVGAVSQKAVAVRRAGANVFFVPADQLKEALSQAGAMKIYPVKTLQQALDDLQALGGDVPAPPSHPAATRLSPQIVPLRLRDGDSGPPAPASESRGKPPAPGWPPTPTGGQ